MTLISSQWAYALDPTIHHWFEQGFSRRASLIPTLFNVQGSESNDEEVASVGAVGIEGWKAYEQTGNVGAADFDQGYKATYTHKEYPLEVPIKRKLAEDSKWNQIFNIAARMGDSAAAFREVDAASVFNNAFSDAFAGADSVGLCSTAHPYSPHKTGSTQSNEGTLSLTKTNIGTVRTNMMAFTDDTGTKVAVSPNLILVPPEREDEALEATGGPLDPDSANNRINPQSTRFKVLPWHYLTDTNAWFMIDAALMKVSLDWFNRVPLTIALKEMDRTIEAVWIAYMRYSFGWSDWRWIYGNNPS
jgi:hypothetical protein